LTLPSPRPAANKFPLGLQFKEYTMGGLHTCGFPASVEGVDIEKEDIGRLVCVCVCVRYVIDKMWIQPLRLLTRIYIYINNYRHTNEWCHHLLWFEDIPQ
jgi:hypothetical protein